MKILITGGAGFIGSALIRFIVDETPHSVVNVDKLTYAGNLESLKSVFSSSRYVFERADICDRRAIERVFRTSHPDCVIHLAAESHVDRSIDGPADFIQTNIVGTFTLLDVACAYWRQLSERNKVQFRFHHVSTDEVFGDLGKDGGFFVEDSPYAPSSPYSATKAGSDHLVRAWHRTYGLPTIVTNCSNNYGPFQFPEKLIPLVVLNALEGLPLPVYGKGMQVRDWLFVEDHARALYEVLSVGDVGATYNIGGNSPMRNIDVVNAVCDLLDELHPRKSDGKSRYSELIEYVEDRPGHDERYAVDTKKVQVDIGWSPKETFESGLRKTINWYLANRLWCNHVVDGTYLRGRLGTSQ